MTTRTSCRALVTALSLRPTVFRMPDVDAFLGGMGARSPLQSTFRLTCYAGLDMGLFLISQIPWGSNAYEFDTLRCPRPLQICFPGYRMPELLQVCKHPHLNVLSRLGHYLLSSPLPT